MEEEKQQQINTKLNSNITWQTFVPMPGNSLKHATQLAHAYNIATLLSAVQLCLSLTVIQLQKV